MGASESGSFGSLPHSEEAERAVLGALLLNDLEATSEAVDRLVEEDLYVPRHRSVFRAIRVLYERGDPVDPVIVHDSLLEAGAKRGEWDLKGVVELAEEVPSAAHAPRYIATVKDLSTRRRLIQAAHGIVKTAGDPEERLPEVLDAVERSVFEVTDQQRGSGSVQGLSKVVNDLLARMDATSGHGSLVTGQSTGFDDLNELTCGFQNGDLIVIAGRPGMGKTALALNFMERISVDGSAGSLMFSLEMNRESIASRLICIRSRVDAQAVRRNSIPASESPYFSQAASDISGAPIYVDDSADLTALGVRARARRQKARGELNLIIVDYLQLLQGDDRRENRQQEVASISRTLKATARELEVPVIALSQLNRAPEQREDPRPRMADLRESGSIEQDADLIMLLYKPNPPKGQEASEAEENLLHLDLAKQRNGPTGRVRLNFQRTCMRFDPWSGVDAAEIAVG